MADFVAGRGGVALAAAVFVLVLLVTISADRQQLSSLEAQRRDAETEAERRASHLGSHFGNVVSSRMGALAAVTLQRVPDDEYEQAVLAAGDSATHHLPGLAAVSLILPDGEILRGTGASLGRWGLYPAADQRLNAALGRSLETGEAAASDVLDLPLGRRFFVFDPILVGDAIRGVLAAELDPAPLFRTAMYESGTDTIPDVFYALYSQSGVLLTSFPAPANWPAVVRSVRVVDADWTLRYPYPPISAAATRAYRLATWLSGLVIALFLPGMILFLRGTIGVQREELERRLRAEERARDHAEQAVALARKSRELALQLEAAQAAAQRVSTSLDVDDVLEIFLGAVGERLGADVGAVYTFEDDGEVVVGRKRVLLRRSDAVPAELQAGDIQQVRAPVALLPVIAEAVSSGRTHVERGERQDGVTGARAAPASVAIPLLVGGHTVGVALWEAYSGDDTFDADRVVFGEALAASAAAALRTAELFRSLARAKERALRDALRFATVLDQMADAVVVVDGKGEVELSNPAAEALLGRDTTRAPLVEWAGLLDIEGADGRPLSITGFPLTRALAGERVDRAIFRIKRANAEERRVAASAAPLMGSDGSPAGAAIVLHDVTDEHQYAELLLHKNRELLQQATMLEEMNRRLRDATAAKDRFLAVMSHELRTPLNAVIGYSDLLEMGIKGELSAEQKAMVVRIRQTSGHLLGLITDVLDLAKIGSGRMDLVLRDLEVEPLLQQAMDQIVPQAAAKRLDLRMAADAGAGDPVVALADETRLRQIMLNLLTNAVKFTDHGAVEVSYRRSGDQVEVSVRDSGPGIPADQLQRIFEEFFQLDSGYARNRGGTGLGLAISWRLARLMGGDLRVESEVGRGSEFTVSVPAVAPVAGGPGGLGAQTLAVMTPDASLVTRLARTMAGRARLLGASDPAAFADIARREAVTLVVLDATAPDCTAWRAVRAMQDPETGLDAPTLFVIPHGDGMDRCLDLGPVTVRAMPFDVAGTLVSASRLAGLAEGAENVLIVDDMDDRRTQVAAALESAGCQVRSARSAKEALEQVAVDPPEVLFCDLLLDGDGPALLVSLRADPAVRDVAVVGMIPAELDPQEMRGLDHAMRSLSHAPEPPVVELADAISDALQRLRRQHQRSERPGDTVPA